VTREEQRLEAARERKEHWLRWGPYVSERAWGTVREDYSEGGTAWEYFPHDHARARAYRWNEDGLAGVCDRHQRVCLALALWNERDSILKERLFGLTGNEGNHGEDVKEYYFYLDSTPTHSYMRYLYKYPQAAFPYAALVEENRRRDRNAPEFELADTGVFEDDRYFDVEVEYAKAGPEDLLWRVTATNRGPDPAPLRLLPTVWFRNTWSWGDAEAPRPRLARADGQARVELWEPHYGTRWLACDAAPELLFTENQTNARQLFGFDDGRRYTKDGIDAYVVRGQSDAVDPAQRGTKVAAHYAFVVAPGEQVSVRLRFSEVAPEAGVGPDFDTVFELRKREAEAFYATVIPDSLSPDAASVMRQAFAGLLWSKQF